MAVNYESVKESDGTYTIKDVEIAAKGLWRPAGAPESGFKMSDRRLGDIMDADAKIRQFVQPAIRDGSGGEKHQPGNWLGALGPYKRAGEKILADLRGLTETVFRAITSGAAGRVSPEIRLDWTEPSTNTTYPIVLSAIAFIGGSMPAMTNLKPVVSFENNGEAITLLELIEDEPDKDQLALFAAPKDQKEEDEMSQEELDRLKAQAQREATAELEEEKRVFQEEQTKQRAAFEEEKAAARTTRIKQLMTMATPKIAPEKVEATLKLAMLQPDEALELFFADIMERPDVKLKDTSKSTLTPSDENTPNIGAQIQEKVMAFQAAEPDADLKSLYVRAEMELGQEEVRAWYEKDIPKEKNVITKEQANRLEVEV